MGNKKNIKQKKTQEITNQHRIENVENEKLK